MNYVRMMTNNICVTSLYATFEWVMELEELNSLNKIIGGVTFLL